MCCCSEKSLKRWGLLLMICFAAGAIACIILAGINFKYTNINWSGGGWKSLAAVEIASIIYVFVTIAVGIFTFCCQNICMIIIFCILLSLSMIFTFAIAVFGLVGGSVGTLTKYVGCQSEYTGILSAYSNIDNYLIQVDSKFCSTECPCYISDPTQFTTTAITPFYAQWVQSPTGATAFQNCTAATQKSAYDSYMTGSNDTFNAERFMEYYGSIEKSFNCTGFCTTSYNHPTTTTPMKMYKYMFSDINRGPSENLGCLASVVNWLPPLLKGFGAVALVVSFAEVVVFIMAISLCCAHKKNKKAKHAEENNK